MPTLYTQQRSNVQKTWAYLVGFIALIGALGYVFSVVYHNPFIFYGALGFSLVMNIVSYWFSDSIALSMAGAHEIEKKDDPELWNLVENLAITAGLPMPKVYRIQDPAPNAFATGRNKEHAAIAVTSGLRTLLNKNELEGVIAHEMAHIGNRDILLSTVVVVLVGLVAALSDFFLRSNFTSGSESRDRGGNPLAIVGIVLALLSPIAATLIQLAISRKREFLADATGALLTRYPEGLASALMKIERYSHGNPPLQHASQATAHMYFVNPFESKASLADMGVLHMHDQHETHEQSGAMGDHQAHIEDMIHEERPGLLQRMFMTHPPSAERISALVGRSSRE